MFRLIPHVRMSCLAGKRPSNSIHWVALLLLVNLAGCHVAATQHNLEGKRLYEQGQYNEALSSFQAALQDDPQSADAFYNMAAVYHRLGAESNNQEYLGQAQELYRQTLDVDPNNADAYRGLSVLYVQAGQQQAAFDLLESWVIKNPESAEPRVELARMYKEYGNSNAARDHLAAAVQKDPSNVRALRALGQLNEEQGQYNQALTLYETAIQQNSLQPDLTAHIAALRQSIGATNAAPSQITLPPGTRVVDAGSIPVRQ